jgi:hypothetical protein
MENKTKTDDNKFAQNCCNVSCYQSHESPAGCCEDINENSDCHSMMAECMKKYRWFPLFPVVI